MLDPLTRWMGVMWWFKGEEERKREVLAELSRTEIMILAESRLPDQIMFDREGRDRGRVRLWLECQGFYLARKPGPRKKREKETPAEQEIYAQHEADKVSVMGIPVTESGRSVPKAYPDPDGDREDGEVYGGCGFRILDGGER